MSTLVSLACMTSGATAVACSPKNETGMQAQSAERQSETEYDVARDLFYRGQNRAALEHAQKACELNDENDKALYFTSAIYASFCEGDRGFSTPDCHLDLAEKYARKAIDANDKFRDAKNLLGQILINEKKYGEAIKVLDPLTRDPAYTESFLAWGNLGLAQVMNGSVDDGIASLKNSVTQPKFCVGHYRLALAYEKKNDTASAEKSYSDALAVESPECQGLQVAWEGRGRARAKLGRPDDAKKDFEKCRDLSAKTDIGATCTTELASLANPGAGNPGSGGKP